MRINKFNLTVLQNNIITVLLYALIFTSFLIDNSRNEGLFVIIIGFVFLTGGTIGFLTQSIAFIPIISDFIGLKGYKDGEPIAIIIGTSINVFFAIVGFVILVGYGFTFIAG